MFGITAKMRKRDAIAIIKARLRELGLTAAEASKKAVGNETLIANMGRPRYGSPTMDSLVALADALGLEFYFGPKRDIGPPDPSRPAAGDVRIGDEEFSLVSRYDVNVSAGAGLVPASEAADGALAFSRTWLARQHINADLAGLVKVRGDSMAPTVPDGAAVLVHCPEMTVDREGIYALSRDGEAYVKRLLPVDRAPDGRPRSMVIISDNNEYPPEVVTGAALNDIRIVGRVRCVMVDLP